MLAQSLGVASSTAGRYIDLLVDLGLVCRLEPWFSNTGKRLTKTPKIYVRDTGLLHSLLELDSLNALRGHPAVGGSFESLCVESPISAAPSSLHLYFYRTPDRSKDEIGLIFVKSNQPIIAVEVKLSTAPVLVQGYYRTCDALGITERYLVYPGQDSYRHHGVTVTNLDSLTSRIRHE